MTGAIKHDTGKPTFDLLPFAAHAACNIIFLMVCSSAPTWDPTTRACRVYAAKLASKPRTGGKEESPSNDAAYKRIWTNGL